MFKELQVLTGAGGPKVAEQAGPVGGGALAEPMGDERAKWQEENERKAKGMKAGGMVSSASSRADGCVTKGKTRGKMV